MITWSKVFSSSGSGIVSAGSCYNTTTVRVNSLEGIIDRKSVVPDKFKSILSQLKFFNLIKENKTDPTMTEGFYPWRNKLAAGEVDIKDLKSSMPALVPSVVWTSKQDKNCPLSPKRNLIQDSSNWDHTGLFCIELDLGKHGNNSDAEVIFQRAKKACASIDGFVCMWQSLNYGVKAIFTADRTDLHVDDASERHAAHEAIYLCLLNKLESANKSLNWDGSKDLARLQFLSTNRKFYENKEVDSDYSISDEEFEMFYKTVKPKKAIQSVDEKEQAELELGLNSFADWCEENGYGKDIIDTLRNGFTETDSYYLFDFCPCCSSHSTSRRTNKDLSVRRDPETDELIFHCFHTSCQSGISSRDSNQHVSSMREIYSHYTNSLLRDIKMTDAFGFTEAENTGFEDSGYTCMCNGFEFAMNDSGQPIDSFGDVVGEADVEKDIDYGGKLGSDDYEEEEEVEQEKLKKFRVDPLPDADGVITHVPKNKIEHIVPISSNMSLSQLQVYNQPLSGWKDQYKDPKTNKIVVAKTDANIIWFLSHCMQLKGVQDLMTKEEYLVNTRTGIIVQATKTDLSYVATVFESYAGWTSSERVTRAVDSLIKVSPSHPFLDGIDDWDGHDHIADLLRTIHTEEGWEPPIGKEEFLREVFEVWLCAAYFRCLNHAYLKNYAKHISNICPILVGAQGIFKNRWIRQLANVPRMLTEQSKISPSNKDDVALSLSCVVIHIDEVESNTLRSADLSEFKSYMTKAVIQFRQPYDRRSQSHLVQASFIGSTNQNEYLVDESGSRRFYTIPVESLDVGDEFVNINQVWAQAKSLVQSGRNLFVDKKIELSSVEMNINHSEEAIADSLCQHVVFTKDPLELNYRNIQELYGDCWTEHFGTSIDIMKITRRERNSFRLCLLRMANKKGHASDIRVNKKIGKKVLHMYPFKIVRKRDLGLEE